VFRDSEGWWWQDEVEYTFCLCVEEDGGGLLGCLVFFCPEICPALPDTYLLMFVVFEIVRLMTHGPEIKERFARLVI